jgi:hypothetical protein
MSLAGTMSTRVGSGGSAEHFSGSPIQSGISLMARRAGRFDAAAKGVQALIRPSFQAEPVPSNPTGDVDSPRQVINEPSNMRAAVSAATSTSADASATPAKPPHAQPANQAAHKRSSTHAACHSYAQSRTSPRKSCTFAASSAQTHTTSLRRRDLTLPFVAPEVVSRGRDDAVLARLLAAPQKKRGPSLRAFLPQANHFAARSGGDLNGYRSIKPSPRRSTRWRALHSMGLSNQGPVNDSRELIA